VAVDLDAPGHPGLGVARYIRLADDPRAAEVAVAVNDHHHRRGIGTLLLEVVALTALDHGIDRLVASVLSDNGPTRALITDLGGHLKWDGDLGALRAVVPIPSSDAELARPAVARVLRAAARGEIQPRLSP
jgi:GNAT superfamily N-acetyltransferase